ncbi:MAG: antibiotic biosynthesis monooxygenase [Winogradskyella sp.]|uniref:antibiotic biosynthesis monooxygenase family protein n=1 Tax=Winogradskyella sp. TaxID=1883156 RepID=UPI000F3F3F9A|nr:antibiotic biosynthesis monooxygenase [Winogradskyella sp.]RNC88468.1 MAG: antibiotic biosynthesis monooxygenase [Winogradskyella sp.]
MNKNKSYYAVIFSSTHGEIIEGYSEMAQKMEDLAKTQDGYLGFESAKGSIGISISYWESLDAIKQWKANSEHLLAQQKGREQWYNWYKVRICKVEREYDYKR